MEKKVISFIGLGDVGSRYSAGLAKEGAIVKGYDLLLGRPEFAEKENRCREAGVQLVSTPREIIEGSDIILVPTTCEVAVETAKMYAPFLKPGQIYADYNSAVPSVKKAVEEIIAPTGADFVDAVTMMSPIQFWHKNPCKMSGPKAKETVEYLNSWGMQIEYVGEAVGRASALKVLRSIYTKGLEAILVECLASAKAFGIMDEIFDSIVHMMDDNPNFEQLSLMVRTDVVHCKRRGEEIRAISDMLEGMGLENTMANAAATKLEWAAKSGVKEYFDGQIPEDLHECVEAYLKASKKA